MCHEWMHGRGKIHVKDTPCDLFRIGKSFPNGGRSATWSVGPRGGTIITKGGEEGRKVNPVCEPRSEAATSRFNIFRTEDSKMNGRLGKVPNAFLNAFLSMGRGAKTVGNVFTGKRAKGRSEFKRGGRNRGK